MKALTLQMMQRLLWLMSGDTHYIPTLDCSCRIWVKTSVLMYQCHAERQKNSCENGSDENIFNHKTHSDWTWEMKPQGSRKWDT